jgi:hypothetical protein
MTTGVPLQLSTVKPDFDSLLLQLQLYLNTKGSWIDLLTSSTGETLMELMSGVGAFNQFSIELAAREGFLITAARDSSIYAIANMLGVRITRKAPASVSVTLANGGDITQSLLIAAYSQFTINNVNYFNRQSILFNSGISSVNTTLYEGTVNIQSFLADSTEFKQIFLNESGFIVADTDVVVSMVDPTTNISSIWLPINQGIWTAASTDNVYYDTSNGYGDCVLQFGDGVHGALPTLGNNIQVLYVTTKGSLANNSGTNLQVQLTTNVLVQGITTSPIANGADEKNSAFYKVLAPYIRRANSRAVTPPDYKAIASSYPGVSSVTIQGQRDIAPNDLRWMNVVRICILPQYTDSFNTNQWDDFNTWFTQYYHAAIHIVNYNPIKIVENIHISVSILDTALPSDVKPLIQANIQSLYAKSYATLGKKITTSDIIKAALVLGVDYVDMVSSTVDAAPDSLSYLELGTLQIDLKYTERTFYAIT